MTPICTREAYTTNNDTTAGSNFSPNKINLWWYREAYNTLAAIHSDNIQPLHDYRKSIHPNIKYTKEILDVYMSLNPYPYGTLGLDIDVYCKLTHTNQ